MWLITLVQRFKHYIKNTYNKNVLDNFVLFISYSIETSWKDMLQNMNLSLMKLYSKYIMWTSDWRLTIEPIDDSDGDDGSLLVFAKLPTHWANDTDLKSWAATTSWKLEENRRWRYVVLMRLLIPEPRIEETWQVLWILKIFKVLECVVLGLFKLLQATCRIGVAGCVMILDALPWIETLLHAFARSSWLWETLWTSVWIWCLSSNRSTSDVTCKWIRRGLPSHEVTNVWIKHCMHLSCFSMFWL